MGRIQFSHGYDEIISVDNLLEAWKEFKRGKAKKEGVQQFQFRLMAYILTLYEDLRNRTYRHGSYKHFRITDPKSRDIHKASVRDRLLHHAIYRKLYPFFDRTFIADSYSCRIGKGAHKALSRFQYFFQKVSQNNSRSCWVLKCDIKKFFASIDHQILFRTLESYISDVNILFLLQRIVSSFSDTAPGVGLPLGNLTSQLLVNIYMNKFDQWMKHALKARYYIRYADDFVILHQEREYLEGLLPKIDLFLKEKLKLSLHPDKVFIKTLSSGVDFLGWVHFPDHRVLRTTTKRRMLKKIASSVTPATLQSYKGLLKHGNAWKLEQMLPQFEKTV